MNNTTLTARAPITINPTTLDPNKVFDRINDLANNIANLPGNLHLDDKFAQFATDLDLDGHLDKIIGKVEDAVQKAVLDFLQGKIDIKRYFGAFLGVLIVSMVIAILIAAVLFVACKKGWELLIKGLETKKEESMIKKEKKKREAAEKAMHISHANEGGNSSYNGNGFDRYGQQQEYNGY